MTTQRIGGYVLVAVLAAAAGAAAMRLLETPSGAGELAEAIDVIDIADVSLAQAEALRASRYESLATIEDVLALPGEFAELEALYAVAARADSAEVQNLLYQAARVGDPVRRDAFVRVLLTRLVEIDPRTALAVVDGPLRRSGRDYTGFVWAHWARRDFESALTEASMSAENPVLLAKAFYVALPGLDDPRVFDVEAMLGVAPDPEVRARALERAYADGAPAALALLETRSQWSRAELSTFARLLYVDLGPSALEWIEGNVSASLGDAVRGLLLERLAEDEPLEAFDRIEGVMSSKVSRATMQKALATLIVRDRDAALAALDRARPGDRARLEVGMLRSLAMADPAGALALVDELRYASRDNALAQIGPALAGSDFDLGVSVVLMISSPRQQRVLLGALARSAPLSRIPELAERMSAIPDGGGPRFPQTNLINNWASRDAEAALAWVQSRPESEQTELLGGVLSHIADEDPQRAIDMAMNIEGGQAFAARLQLVDRLVQHQHIDYALSLANMSPDADARGVLQLRVLNLIARREPERALEMARTLGDGGVVDQVLSTTLMSLASRDPRSALSRAGEISDPDVRAATERSVMLRLASQDPGAAREMIAAMPPGPARDGALTGLVRQDSFDIDEAIQLAGQITDETLRQQTQASVVFRLAQRDPGAARELADSIDLPAAQRQRLEQRLRHAGGGILR